MDIGDSSGVEIMNEFLYLGDMLSVDGDADAAVTARIRSGGLSSGHWPLITTLIRCITAVARKGL